MKLSLSTIIAVALSSALVWAEGPVEKAGDVAEDAVETAKNVGHKVVKGTKEVVHKVVGAVTPDPDARRVDVTLSNDKIDMPTCQVASTHGGGRARRPAFGPHCVG